MMERQVIVETAAGEKRGKLVSKSNDAVVLMGEDGKVVTVDRKDITGLRAQTQKAVDTAKKAEPKTDDKPKAKEDEYKKLGLFTSHGLSYSHWRTSSYRAGAAAYALDLGVGYNFSDKLGVYGLLGGDVGARMLGRTVGANYGYFAAAVRIKRKWLVVIPGLGVAFSDLRGPNDERHRDAGLAIPIKIMGAIKLPKDLFLGIGLGYNLAFLRGGRIHNGISAQLTLGRW